MAINYVTKWVETHALYMNIISMTTRFICECILTRFGFPLVLVIKQRVHISNDAINILIDHFLLNMPILQPILCKGMDVQNLLT
jgi:hypothetical protein